MLLTRNKQYQNIRTETLNLLGTKYSMTKPLMIRFSKLLNRIFMLEICFPVPLSCTKYCLCTCMTMHLKMILHEENDVLSIHLYIISTGHRTSLHCSLDACQLRRIFYRHIIICNKRCISCHTWWSGLSITL
jgi:hypothetical protein